MTEKEKKQNPVSASIKKIAKEKGLTLAELANRMKSQGSTLHQTINGNPTIGTLERIAQVLECNVKSFFEVSENELYGLVQYKGHTYKIDSVESLKRLLSDIEKADF